MSFPTGEPDQHFPCDDALVAVGQENAFPWIERECGAWGVLAGSAMGPFALPLYGCIKSRIRWFPILSFRNQDLMRYLWLSFPIMIGFSIVVVDEWIVKNQASYLAAGALSYLQYGRTLMKVPIGVFGMAAGVAAYPTLSRLVATGRSGGGIRPSLRPAVRVMLVRNVCGASLHDISRVRSGILSLGLVL